MNAGYFIVIVLVSGFVAGTIHGAVNLAIVEPYLDKAIGIENQALFESGEAEDTPQFWVEYNAYRDWQKSGQLLAGGILGMSIGALFGIVFAYSRNSLPKGHTVKKTFVLAAIMWLTIFLIPFLKYPANPPTVGDGDTVILRGILYLSFIAISGLTAVGFYKIFKRLKDKKRILAFIGYGAFISIIFLIMPENPDKINAPMELVNGFRAVAFLTSSVFWFTLALILGAFWQKTNPDLSST